MTQPPQSDNAYPSAWDPPGQAPSKRPAQPPETPAAAVQFSIEAYVAALSDAEFTDLTARTRPAAR